MRFLIIICFLLSFNVNPAQTLQLQEQKTPQELYNFHIQKRKTNNTVGWITLGGGIAMVVGGISWNLSQGVLDNDTSNNSQGIWLSYLGGAVTIASVPLFISAGKHKKKANLYLSQGALGFNNEYRISGLGIAFRF